VVLLAGAGLMLQSFARMLRAERGFQPDHLLTAELDFSVSGFTTWVRPTATRPQVPLRELIERLRALPGVQVVGAGSRLLRRENRPPHESFAIFGRPALKPEEQPKAEFKGLTPDWLHALGARVLHGRDFTEADTLEAPGVVLINETLAKRYFPNEDPIGKQMYFGTDNGIGLVTEVVGVVGDIRSNRLDRTNDVEFYRPFPQRTAPFEQVVVRTLLKPEAAATMVRTTLNRIDPGLPIIQPTTMETIVNRSLGQQRLTMTLLGVFAGVALVLAAVGIYGAVAYTVEQRTGEIGVRMALGAQTADVLRLVVRQGMMPVIIGLALGLAAALAMGRLLTAQLYEVSAHSPALLAGTAVMLGAVALFACLMPARRATLVNPIQALRTE
jgi:putative ABC transport system permease protein